MIVPGTLEQDRRKVLWPLEEHQSHDTPAETRPTYLKTAPLMRSPIYISLRISVENAVRNELTSLGAVVAETGGPPHNLNLITRDVRTTIVPYWHRYSHG